MGERKRKQGRFDGVAYITVDSFGIPHKKRFGLYRAGLATSTATGIGACVCDGPKQQYNYPSRAEAGQGR